jgi:hypothetical protein
MSSSGTCDRHTTEEESDIDDENSVFFAVECSLFTYLLEPYGMVLCKTDTVCQDRLGTNTSLGGQEGTWTTISD